MKNLNKLMEELNKIADEELNPKPAKFKCTTGNHTSDLSSTRVGDECICNGTFQLNI